MTITINVPIFPLRKEIAARKRRMGLSLSLPLRGAAASARDTDLRYTADGLEFDVAGFAQGLAKPAKGRGGQ